MAAVTLSGSKEALEKYGQTQADRRCWCEQRATPDSQPAQCPTHLAASEARRAKRNRGAGSAVASPAPVRPVERLSDQVDPPTPTPLPKPLEAPVEASDDPIEEELDESPKAAARVRVEPEPVTARVPSREEICILALDVYKLALDNVNHYVDKHGTAKSKPQPDFRGACEALRVVSTVAGYSAKGEPPTARNSNESALDAEEALKRMRARIAKNIP